MDGTNNVCRGAASSAMNKESSKIGIGSTLKSNQRFMRASAHLHGSGVASHTIEACRCISRQELKVFMQKAFMQGLSHLYARPPLVSPKSETCIFRNVQEVELRYTIQQPNSCSGTTRTLKLPPP